MAWSLEIEIQFYMLMPLIAGVLSLGKWRRPLLLLCIVAFSALRLTLDPMRTVLSVLGNLQFFLAGLLQAELYVLGLPEKSC